MKKFRLWYKRDKIMSLPFTLYELMTENGISSDLLDIAKNNKQLFESDFNKEIIFMQYVGYNDMNGKDIYEGDILKHKDTFQGEFIDVVLNILGTHHNLFSPGGYVEIIGNIHENPELIP